MGRKPIIAGNWKMHMNHLEAIGLVQKTHYMLRDEHHDAVDTVVCPPFTALRAVQTTLEGEHSRIMLGAQNCHWEDKGAYTGEISPSMLERLKCSFVIVGHSERRAMFGETDEIVNKKAKAVFAAGMTPIICVGETDEQREAGQTDEIVGGQVRGSLKGLTEEQFASVVVAYEPVWAIGTGKTASPEDADATCGLVRKTVGDIGGDPEIVRVQYGGSVKPGNIRDLMAKPNIDGALVGGASLDAEDFALIVRHLD
jgi:triosephosphate isomerase (TIM)